MRGTRLLAWSAVASATLLVGAGPARADTKTCIGVSEEGQRQRGDKKLVAAKDLFDSCSSSSCPQIVRDDCIGWAKEVEAQLPTIVFVARDTAGKDVQGASVLIDGSSSHIVDGTPVQLDPGGHALEVSLGDRKQKVAITVLEGEKNRRVLFTLPEATSAPAPKRVVAPPPKEGIPIVPFIVGGASIVLLGLGVFEQLNATSEEDKSKGYLPQANLEASKNSACGVPNPSEVTCPYAHAVYAHHDTAKSDQAIGLPLIGIGAVGVVASGVFLYLLWPKAPRPSQSSLTLLPSFGPGASSLGLRGAF